MRIKEEYLCVCVLCTCARALLNEVFDASSASCSEAFGACAGAEMDAANFSISVRISECVRGEGNSSGGGGRREDKKREDKIRDRKRSE